MTDQKPQGRELGRGLSALLGDDEMAKPQVLLADQRGLSLPVDPPVRPGVEPIGAYGRARTQRVQ